MGIMYQNAEIAIREHFFSKKVSAVDFRTGQSKVASPEEMARCALYLNAVKLAQLSESERNFAFSYIFERFARSVLDRDSLGAAMFMTNNPKTFLDALDTTILVERGELPFPFI